MPIQKNIYPVPVFRILILIFFTVPLIEIYFLLQVSRLVGILPTISLCVLTAVAGAALLRHQGINTLTRVQAKLARGEVPAIEMMGGVILLLSGALLLTPGFFTDVIGFLCLVPRLREWVAAGIFKHFLVKHQQGEIRTSVTLDGEYWEDERKRFKR